MKGKIRAVPLLLLFLSLLVLTSSKVWAKPTRKVIRLEAMKVEGRIQKPEAFYILQRSNLNFEALELHESFIPKIVDSVNHKPF